MLADVDGQKLRYGGATWYKVALTYGAGQSIVVSLAVQFLWAFDADQVALAAGCTTSCKGLATPVGDYAVMKHVRNYTFNSPWRKGSISWYPTVQASYPLLFHARPATSCTTPPGGA